MSTPIKLEFLSNEGDEDEGLGNAGIETYRDEPYAGTARETGQNSRDAARELPVRITFDAIGLIFADIPGMESLRDALKAGLSKARSSKDRKEIAFFEQALKVASSEPVQTLRIADFNTTGLRGPAVSGTPFNSLVKGSGVSKKEADTSGGSFGIGKNAAFALSDLQTVFYSTLYEDVSSGRPHFLAQGKSVLVSHTDREGRPRRASGYWGLSNFKPVERAEEVPAWLRRDEPGTSVFSLGFRETEGWQQHIICSLIQNFFFAVNSEEMEFSVDGAKTLINKGSLPALFASNELRQAAEKTDSLQELELARDLYRCLTAPESIERIAVVPALGRVLIKVLVAEGLPKKVCIIRNGMVITETLEHFGHKFRQFPMHRDFVAIAVPLDDEGRAFIKRLENPKHDGLSAERLPDEGARKNARKVMKAFAVLIKDTIRSHSLPSFDDEVSVDELTRFFATEAPKTSDGNDSEEHDPETVTIRIEPRKVPARPRAATAGSGSGGGSRSAGGGKNGGAGGGGSTTGAFPSGSGPEEGGTARPLWLGDIRNIRTDKANARLRKIFFTPEEGGSTEIILEATGLDSPVNLEVVKSSTGTVENGRIKRALVAGERAEFEIEFAEPYEGPIEIRATVTPASEASSENK